MLPVPKLASGNEYFEAILDLVYPFKENGIFYCVKWECCLRVNNFSRR